MNKGTIGLNAGTICNLLLDEEEEIIEECLDIKEENLNYKIIKKRTIRN